MSLHYGPKDGNPLLVNNLPTVLLRLEGNWAGADGLFLQVHDSATIAGISAATIVKSYYLQGNFIFSYSFINAGISLLKGCVIAVSQNADPSAYTAYAGTATNLMLECEIEPWQLVNPASLTAVGDLTTGVDSMNVWLSAAGPNKLYQIDVINGNGAACFLCLFFNDNALNGIIPRIVMPLANVATVQSFRFGDDGLLPFGKNQKVSSGITGDAGGAENLGLFAGVSVGNAAGFFTTYAENGGALCNIRAFYSTTQVQPIAVLQPVAL